MSVHLRVEGLERVRQRLGVNFIPVMKGITSAVGELVRSEIAQYPGSVVHPIQWASLAQRRAYFALRRSRGLPLGYTRQFDAMSQRLGPSWTVSPHGAIGAQVATRATYAPYVQSEEKQQPMHRATGWRTDKQAVDIVQRSGNIARILEAAVRAALGV